MNGKTFSRRLRSEWVRHSKSVYAVALLIVILGGCGVGEDFSKPPEELAGRKLADADDSEAKAPASADSPLGDPGRGDPAENSPGAENGTARAGDGKIASSEATPPNEMSADGDLAQQAGPPEEEHSSKSAAGAKDSPKQAPGEGEESSGGLLGMLKTRDPAEATSPASEPAAAESEAAAPMSMVSDLSVSGNVLVSERAEGRIGVYDTLQRSVLMSFQATEQDVSLLRFSDSSKVVAAALPSGKIQLWQYQSTAGLDRFAQQRAAELAYLRTLEGHPGGTTDLAFSPSRAEIASTGADGFLRLWAYGQTGDTKTYPQAAGEMRFARVSQNGAAAAAVTGANELTVWDLESGEKRSFPLIARPLTCLAIDDEGALVAVGDSSGGIQLIHTRGDERDELIGHKAAVADLVFDRSSPRLLSITTTAESRIWELPYQPSESLEKLPASGGIFALSADKRRLVAEVAPGQLSLRNLAADRPPQTLETSIQDITSLEFAGADIVVTGDSGRLNLLREDNTGVSFTAAAGRQTVSVSSGAGGQIITVDPQGRSFLWSSPSPVMMSQKRDGPDDVVASGFDESSRSAVWVTTGGRISICDMTTGKIVASWLTPAGAVSAMDISGEGRCVITGDAEGLLSLWRTDAPGAPVILARCPAGIRSIAISADARVVYAGCENGEIKAVPIQQVGTADPFQLSAEQKKLRQIWSRNAAWLVTHSDTELQFVDTATGMVEPIPVGESIQQVIVSDDGTQAGVLTKQGQLLLCRRGQQNVVVLVGESDRDRIVAVAYRPQTTAIHALHLSGRVSIPETQNVPDRLPEALRQIVSSAANETRGLIAFGTTDGNIHFASLKTLTPEGDSVRCDGPVTQLGWLSNDMMVVVLEGEPVPRLLDVNGRMLRKSSATLPGAIKALCQTEANNEMFALIGNRIAKLTLKDSDLLISSLAQETAVDAQLAASNNGLLLSSGGRLYRVARSGDIEALDLLPDVTGVMAGGRTEILLTREGGIYQLVENKTEKIGQESETVISGVIAGDGRSALLLTASGILSLWSVDQKSRVAEIDRVDAAGICRVMFVDQDRAALLTDGKDSRLRPLNSWREIESTVKSPTGLQFSEDGSRLFVRGTTDLCMITPGRPDRRNLSLTENVLACFGESSDVLLLADAVGNLRRIQGTDEQTMKLPGAARDMVFDPRSGSIRILSADGRDLWAVSSETWKQISAEQLSSECRELAMTADGLVGVDVDGSVRRLENQVSVLAEASARAHEGACTAVAIVQGSVWTAGDDGYVRQWRSDLSEKTDFAKHNVGLSSLRAASDNRSLLLTDLSGKAIRFSISDAGDKAEIDMPNTAAVPVDFHNERGWLFRHERYLIQRSESTANCEIWSSANIADVCRLEGDDTSPTYFAVHKDSSLARLTLVQRVLIRNGSSSAARVHLLNPDKVIFVSSNVVDVYNLSGQRQTSFSPGNSDVIASSLSGDGQALILSFRSGDIAVFQTSNWEKKNQFRSSKPASMISCNETGDSLLIAGGTNEIELWDLQRAVLLRILKGHPSVVRMMVFSGKKNEILSADVDGEFRLWGEPRIDAKQIELSDSVDARLLPDGLGAVTLSAQGQVTLWDQFSRKAWQKSTSLKSLQSVCLDSAGRRLAVFEATPAGQLTIYDRNAKSSQTIQDGQEKGLVFSNDGERLIHAEADELRILDAASGQKLYSINAKAADVLYSNSRHVVVIGTDGSLQRLNEAKLANLKVSSSAVTAVAYHNDGDSLVTGDAEGVVALWKREAGQLNKQREFRVTGAVRQLIYDGKLIVCRSDSRTIQFWVLEGPAADAEPLSVELDHTVVPGLMRLDSRQELLVTTGEANSALLWYLDFSPGPPRKVLSIDGHEHPIMSLALNESQQQLVTVDTGSIVSKNPIPDISELRQLGAGSSQRVQSTGILDDLPQQDAVRGRNGEGRLTQQLIAQEKLRRDRLSAMQRKSEGRSEGGNMSSDAEDLQNARTAQLVMNLSGDGAGGAGDFAGLMMAAAGGPGGVSTPGSAQGMAEMVQQYQAVETLPQEMESASATAAARGSDASVLAKTMRGSILQNQKSLVRNLNKFAVDSILNRFFRKDSSSAEKERMRAYLQSMTDSRAIQTIRSDFNFSLSRDSLGVHRLQISRDGRTIITSSPLKMEDATTTETRVDVWDMLTGVCLKQFEAKGAVQDVILNPEETHVLTVPDGLAYSLYRDAPSSFLSRMTRVSFQNRPGQSVAALTREVQREKLEPLLQFHDSASLEQLSVRMPTGFNAVARAFRFASHEDLVAISISSTDTAEATTRLHRLYLCSTGDLESFEVLSPLDFVTDEESGGQSTLGFISLAFSEDDTSLFAIVRVRGEESKEVYLVNRYERRNGKWSRTTSVPLAAELAPAGDRVRIDVVQATGRILIQTDSGLFLADKFASASPKNGSRRRDEVSMWKVPFPSDMSTLSVSDNCRWAAIGTKSGGVFAHNLAGPDPSKALRMPLIGGSAHEGPVLSLNFSRPLPVLLDPTYVVTLGKENLIKIWDLVELMEKSKEPVEKYQSNRPKGEQAPSRP